MSSDGEVSFYVWRDFCVFINLAVFEDLLRIDEELLFNTIDK